MRDRIATIIFWLFAATAAIFLLWARYRPDNPMMAMDGDNISKQFIRIGLPIALLIGILGLIPYFIIRRYDQKIRKK